MKLVWGTLAVVAAVAINWPAGNVKAAAGDQHCPDHGISRTGEAAGN